MAWHTRVFLVGAALACAIEGAPAAAQGPSAPVAEEFANLHFRSIGPATMSGRISDLAVYEANPAIYYVATAHGGVWKTTSNGALFEPLFQNEGLIATGDVTISQSDPNLVWVGAGESNNRQSTSWGGGVYKSTDGGKTFTHMGLGTSRAINRIVIDPNNNDIVMVAATGSLFGPGGDRGVYRTTNGGRTWTHVLRVDESTGANDLVMSPTDPRTLFASTYQRQRNACCMNGGGPNSGIWKSTDGGATWSRVVATGLPTGPLGRIALDIYRKNANIMYALIEGPSGGGGRGGDEEANEAGGGGRGGQQQQGATGVYRSDDGGATWRKVSSNNPRPMYFSQIRVDPNNADVIYMGGVGLQMSIDGGRTFHTDAAQATHDDVHAIWINPSNSQNVLIGNDGGLAISWDQSKTWTFLPNLPVGLFYHVSYDMETPYNICGGMQDNYNWCGPSRVRMNRGIMNYDWFQIQGGDGFVAMPDLRDSRIVYTESQNGNMIRRNKVTGESKSIRPSAANVVNATAGESYRWNWDTPLILSPNNPGVLLAAAQRVFRSTDRGDSWTVISPDLTTNANRNDIVTMGLRNSQINISRNDGISSWPTLVSLAESPLQAGVIYTGSDDGVVSMTRDGGRTWTNITSRMAGFPQLGYVSEVVPSRYDANTVYVTVDNHLNDDYNTYMWMSSDGGQTFRSIAGNLRGENVRTLTEDQRNRDVLYIGTETGIFLSMDRGTTWKRLKGRNFPTVRVDEITLHPRDNAMLVATHGRAIWVLDQLAPIQEYAAAQRAAVAALFTPSNALQWKSLDNRNDEFWGHQFFAGENPPTDAVLQYFLKSNANDVKLAITDANGHAVRELTAPAGKRQAGIQTVCWDMRVEPIQVPAADAPPEGRGGGGGGGGGQQGGRGGGGAAANIPGVPAPMPASGFMPTNICGGGGGEGGGRGGFGGGGGGGSPGPHVSPGRYNVALVVNGQSVGTKPLDVVMDPAVTLTVAQRNAYNALAMELHHAQQRATNTAGALTSLGRQLGTAMSSAGNLPANVKSQFDALVTEFNTVRTRFGVAAPGQQGGGGQPGGGGGGGGRGGGGGDPANVVARVNTVKSGVLAFWEVPSDALVRQAADAQTALAAAITEANALLGRAATVSQALRPHNITITVPTGTR